MINVFNFSHALTDVNPPEGRSPSEAAAASGFAFLSYSLYFLFPPVQMQTVRHSLCLVLLSASRGEGVLLSWTDSAAC